VPVSLDRAGYRDPVAARKAAIRRAVLAARRRLDAEQLHDRAARVQAALCDLVRTRLAGPGPARSSPAVVTAYVPTGAEPGGSDLPAVLERALPPGTALLLPVLRPDLDLDWARYDGRLSATSRGLREPPGPRLAPEAVAAAELVVVPAVAVDRRGVRLGRGGGSFDRALARVPPGVAVVALLHDGELRGEDLPAEPHDRLVTAALTPAGGLVRLPG
jgi:5-formyltetrahydrofolate cyclo-ligase